MNFKIGDKVKIVSSYFMSKKGKIVTIINIYPSGSGCKYRIKDDKGWECPMYEKELQPMIRKGEQLLLFEL